MNVLFCKTFGIGNAVMAIPAIKALVSLGHHVDILIGTDNDDIGARNIIFRLAKYVKIKNVYLNQVPLNIKHDLAILSIPFDGRWKNGMHFNALNVIDGRTRPDPSTTGLVSWKAHEIEYQIENIKNLGYNGNIPDCSFQEICEKEYKTFFLGIGYKKDAAGFWAIKHWGNDKFVELTNLILTNIENSKVIITGNLLDMQNISYIRKKIKNDRFIFKSIDLDESIDIVSKCEFYVGNDTGMMHVAAANGCKVAAIFKLPGSIIKSRPYSDNAIVFDETESQVTAAAVFSCIEEEWKTW